MTKKMLVRGGDEIFTFSLYGYPVVGPHMKKSKGSSRVISSNLQGILAEKYNINYISKKKSRRRKKSEHTAHEFIHNDKNDIMTSQQWFDVENIALNRPSLSQQCAICHGFYNRDKMKQCLLSCGHVFHDSCISAFEAFISFKFRFCPLCRKEKYEKQKTNTGYSSRKICSAIEIQRITRGYQSRLLFLDLLLTYCLKNPSNERAKCMLECRQNKACKNLLTDISNKMTKEVSIREKKIAEIKSSMIHSIQYNQGILQSCCHATSTDSEISWEIVRKSALNRFQENRKTESQHPLPSCPICLSGLHGRNVSLLSCSHLFCTQCIDAFIQFSKYHVDTPLCPVCRLPEFKKLDLTNYCTS